LLLPRLYSDDEVPVYLGKNCFFDLDADTLTSLEGLGVSKFSTVTYTYR